MSTTYIDDTICAISTPPGVGGIAVARISGPQAISIASSIWKGKNLSQCNTHTAHLGLIVDPEAPSTPLDEAVATIFRTPASFTGEDIVEISVHGSTYIQTELINLLIRRGARMAEPGEFTRRAFANGRMDLAEAEAVADVIASTSAAAHRVAINQMRGTFSNTLHHLRDQLVEIASLVELELDFSEEDVEFADRSHLRKLTAATLDTVKKLAASFSTGDAIRRGIPVAIIGRPNAGKSSVLNLLLGDDRAIVSDIPGTTRDTIEDTATIHGVTYRFIDTAGLRETTDTIENLGIDRTWQKAAAARLIIWVIDASTIAVPSSDLPSSTSDTSAGATRNMLPDVLKELSDFHSRLLQTISPDTPVLILLNKADLSTPATIAQLSSSIASELGLHLSDGPSSGYALLPFSCTQPSPLPCIQHSTLHTPQSVSSPSPSTSSSASPSSSPSVSSSPSSSPYSSSIIGKSNLTDIISSLVGVDAAALSGDAVVVTNGRHYQALHNSIAPLERVLSALDPSHSSSTPLPSSKSLPPSLVTLDLLAQDLREAIHHLSTITGSITAPDLLSTIFSRFCIGK